MNKLTKTIRILVLISTTVLSIFAIAPILLILTFTSLAISYKVYLFAVMLLLFIVLHRFYYKHLRRKILNEINYEYRVTKIHHCDYIEP